MQDVHIQFLSTESSERAVTSSELYRFLSKFLQTKKRKVVDVSSSAVQTPKFGTKNGSEPFASPRFLAMNPLDPDGVYVSEESKSIISRIDLRNNKVQEIANLQNQKSSTRGISFNSKGELFVCCYSIGTILKLTQSKTDPAVWNLEKYAGGGSGFADGHRLQACFSYTMGCCFDSQDTMYITDASNKLVRMIKDDYVYTVGGQVAPPTCQLYPGTKFIEQPFSYAWDIKCNPFDDKELYVGDIDGRKVAKFCLRNFTSTVIGTPSSTENIFVSGDYLYIATYSGIIKMNTRTNVQETLLNDKRMQGVVGDTERMCLWVSDGDSVYFVQ